MAGRQEFETIVASAAKKRLVNFTSSNGAALLAGNSEIVRFYAPLNTIVHIIGMLISIPIPAGGASGNHTIYIGYDNPSIDQIIAGSVFGSIIQYTASMFTSAGFVKQPDTSEAVVAALNNLSFDNVNPLRFTYTNNTNVSQTSLRDIRVWGVAETVGS